MFVGYPQVRSGYTGGIGNRGRFRGPVQPPGTPAGPAGPRGPAPPATSQPADADPTADTAPEPYRPAPSPRRRPARPAPGPPPPAPAPAPAAAQTAGPRPANRALPGTAGAPAMVSP